MKHKMEIKVALAIVIHSHRAVCESESAAKPALCVGPNKACMHVTPLPITKKLSCYHEHVKQPQVFESVHGEKDVLISVTNTDC